MPANSDSGAAFMTPGQMLDLYEAFMGGKPLSECQTRTFGQLALAASFGAEAFARHPDQDGGCVAALLRSFLLALIDPLHADLDHLRNDPNCGPSARAARSGRTAP